MNKNNAGRKRKLSVLPTDRKDQRENAKAFKEAQSGLVGIQLSPPKHLDSKGRYLWRTLVPEMQKIGTLKQVDRINLETLCSTYSIYRDAENEIKEHGSYVRDEDGMAVRKNPAIGVLSDCTRNMRSLCTELGLTFNSRAIKVEKNDNSKTESTSKTPAFKTVKF